MKSTSPRYTHQSERLHHLYVTRPGISHVSLLRPNLANQSHDKHYSPTPSIYWIIQSGRQQTQSHTISLSVCMNNTLRESPYPCMYESNLPLPRYWQSPLYGSHTNQSDTIPSQYVWSKRIRFPGMRRRTFPRSNNAKPLPCTSLASHTTSSPRTLLL